jgi:hypothetical protein
MVGDGKPAKNVRSFGVFLKFFTTCTTAYEVLPAIYSLVLTQHSRHMSIMLA